MGMEQQVITCRVCRRATVHARKSVNHILHLLLAIITGCLWVPVWLLVAMFPGRWQCQDCGNWK